jgi:TM2 domain-containing membrane protein YozV
MNNNNSATHSILTGYLLWILGFLGAHRFYYGKQLSGTLYFFTFGLFFIGWIIDLFLIPGMSREADIRYNEGETDYNIAWLLLAFLGLLGIHRMYIGKWITGLMYLCTAGLLGIGYIYDFWTLNDQISLLNGSPR